MEMDAGCERYENYYREHDYENAFQENYGKFFCMKDLFGVKIAQRFCSIENCETGKNVKKEGKKNNART